MMAKSGVSQKVIDACIVLETLREGNLIQSNGFSPHLKLRDYLLIQKVMKFISLSHEVMN